MGGINQWRESITYTQIGSLFLLGAFLSLAGPTPGQLRATTPVDSEAALALIIRHIGAEDRSVGPLLLFAAGTQEKLVEDFPEYRQGYEWLAIPGDAFRELTARLAEEFFAQGVSDPGLSRPGSYAFVLLRAGGRREVRFNPRHSAALLTRALELLSSGPATAPLQRRLAITRL